jgi:hypothetical protein
MFGARASDVKIPIDLSSDDTFGNAEHGSNRGTILSSLLPAGIIHGLAWGANR